MEFVITTKIRNEEYTYTDDKVKVLGGYSKLITTGQVQSVSGTAYTTNNAFVGNFNGNLQEDGTIKYSMSDISLDYIGDVKDAIANIEQYAADN